MTTTKKAKLPIIHIGADPEVFVKDLRTRNFVSAHPYVKGTKHNPEPWKGGAIQVDGVALEFNIPPAKNAKEFTSSIVDSMHYLQGILTGWDEKLKLVTTPTAFFDEKYFDNLPEEVKALGCEPDYNAYTLDVNPKPETTLPFRTGSGHVHVGWLQGDSMVRETLSEAHMNVCAGIVKQLDIALLVPSLIFDRDIQRRTLYGAPGAFRPKRYGLEYRVLSNRWLRNATLATWVYNTTLRATRDYFRGNIYYDQVNLNELRNIFANLNTRNVDRLARKFVEHSNGICAIPSGYSGGNLSNSRSNLKSSKAA